MQLCFVLVTNEYTFFYPPSQNTLVWESGGEHLRIHRIFASHCCDWGSLGSQGRNVFTKGPNSVSTELGVQTATDLIWLVLLGNASGPEIGLLKAWHILMNSVVL